MVRRALVLALALAGPAAAQGIELESKPARWRLTAERFDASDEERLGLVGAHYDLLGPLEALPDQVYAGVGGYAAVSGVSGGLFLGGTTLGWLQELYPGFAVDLGAFAGAGGGGGADTGDGLAVRPHAALEVALGLVALRAEAAYLWLEDGFEDLHLALGVSLPTELLLARPGAPSAWIPEDAVVLRRVRLRPSVVRLDPDDDARTTGGAPLEDNLDLLGVEVDYFLSRRWLLSVTAHGAGGGESAGFAAALGGLGVSWPLVGPVALEARALGGAGGGGEVDTGGGLLWQARGGLSAALAGGLGVQVEAGWTDAPDGELEATTLAAGLSWSARPVELALDYPRSRLEDEGLPAALARIDPLRLQAVQKAYFPASTALLEDGRELDDVLHLSGVGVERPIALAGQALAVTGRAFAAWAGSGDVGGYAEGLLGLKAEYLPDLRGPHAFTVHGEVGVGGGGGVDVDGGWLYAATAGYRYAVSPALAVSLEGGVVEADRGTFEAELVQVGLTWSVGRAAAR